MMTKTIPGWTYGGSRYDSEHSFLPERGFHHIVGSCDEANIAVAASLAVAVAAGDAGAGLSEPDKDGARRTLGGFFGKAVGGQGSVAILTTRPDAMKRAVEAAALARGVTAQLPIVYASPHGDSMARALSTGAFRLSALKDAMDDNLMLVIIDGISAVTRARYDALQGLTVLESFFACPVFIVAEEPIGVPSQHDSTTLEVGNGVVTFHPAAGEGWAHKFSLDRIRLLDGETVAVRPGEAVAFVGKAVKAKAAKIPVHVESLKEPKVAQRIVYAWTGDRISEAERIRWPEHGFVQSIREAVNAVRAAPAEGLTEIVVVSSHRGGDVRAEARRLITALQAAELDARARIVISDKQLLAPAA